MAYYFSSPCMATYGGACTCHPKKARQNLKVLIGVTGSVATIKLKELVTTLYSHRSVEEVAVIPTEKSEKFFNADEIVSIGSEFEKCDTRIWRDEDEWSMWNGRGDPVLHIELGKWADALILAPLDANTMAKIAAGMCDNLLTCMLRAWDLKNIRNKPVFFCPAMNTKMWDHPLTSEHVEKLCDFGYILIPPVEKTLMCGDSGNGAMASVDAIVDTFFTSIGEICSCDYSGDGNSRIFPKPKCSSDWCDDSQADSRGKCSSNFWDKKGGDSQHEQCNHSRKPSNSGGNGRPSSTASSAGAGSRPNSSGNSAGSRPNSAGNSRAAGSRPASSGNSAAAANTGSPPRSSGNSAAATAGSPPGSTGNSTSTDQNRSRPSSRGSGSTESRQIASAKVRNQMQQQQQNEGNQQSSGASSGGGSSGPGSISGRKQETFFVSTVAPSEIPSLGSSSKQFSNKSSGAGQKDESFVSSFKTISEAPEEVNQNLSVIYNADIDDFEADNTSVVNTTASYTIVAENNGIRKVSDAASKKGSAASGSGKTGSYSSADAVIVVNAEVPQVSMQTRLGAGLGLEVETSTGPSDLDSDPLNTTAATTSGEFTLDSDILNTTVTTTSGEIAFDSDLLNSTAATTIGEIVFDSDLLNTTATTTNGEVTFDTYNTTFTTTTSGGSALDSNLLDLDTTAYTTTGISGTTATSGDFTTDAEAVIEINPGAGFSGESSSQSPGSSSAQSSFSKASGKHRQWTKEWH